MGFQWTKEQRQIIELRHRNILVSAAAGSGKTAVLVQRIMERLLDEDEPVNIDELLVVTFTNAAAAQMRERIRNAIEDYLVEHSNHPRLEQQLALIHNAQITTIDSFCLYVIRNHFHEIGIEPTFRIVEEGEAKLLQEDVLDALLEAEYEKREEGFLALADAYTSGRSDAGLRDIILQVSGYADSYPWPKKWLEQCKEIYSYSSLEEYEQSEYVQELIRYAHLMLRGIVEQIESGIAICESGDGPEHYFDTLQGDKDAIEAILDCSTFDSLYLAIQGHAWGRLATTRGYLGSSYKLDLVKSMREKYKKILDQLKKNFFSNSLQGYYEQSKKQYPMVCQVVQLVMAYRSNLSEAKREKNVVDFSDIEHYALQVLVDTDTMMPTSTAKEFQHAYAEIMIDEYQDSNYVQETILQAISKESIGEWNRFMVGDVKQSIYRFRLARPELFLEKYHNYSQEDGQQQRIDLHQNFRSREEVIQVVNDVFSCIMTDKLGNIQYDEAAKLQPGAQYPETSSDCRAELLLLGDEKEAAEEQNISEEVRDMDRITREALVIVQRIKRLMKEQKVSDEKSDGLRNLRYGDIVILLRSMTDYGDGIAKILNDSGIPAHTTSKEGYFGTPEIQTVLNYLRILDNPLQDIPLASILKSVLVGFTDEDMARIRILGGEGMFSRVFFQLVEEHGLDGELAEKADRFYTTYQELRSQVCELTIQELLQSFFARTGFDKMASAMPGGKQRRANLNMLLEQAHAYEGTSYHGLFHFIRYMDQLQKYDVDYGEADTVGEENDAVRIMSIHKSKGLEFPVVFVSSLGKQFNKQDSRKSVVLHSEYGIGMDEIYGDRHIKIPGFSKKIISKLEELETLGEELRILYVAMTRAKEKLICTGYCKGLNQDTWEQMTREENVAGMGYLDLVQASGYLDWVLPTFLANRQKYVMQYITDSVLIGQEAENLEEETIGMGLRTLMGEEGMGDWNTWIGDSMNYHYPYIDSVNIKLKYSVSELKHRAMREYAQREDVESQSVYEEEPIVPYIPEFVSGERKQEAIHQGALRGTAVHRGMECMDFAEFIRRKIYEQGREAVCLEVHRQLKRMLERQLLTQDMYELIQEKNMVDFMESDIGRRMCLADSRGQLYREKPFVLGQQEEEMILIQGIIDVFWLEDDHIILLDYKTDRVSKAEELVGKYRKQMELYAEALEKIWKLPVREIYLYSFSLHCPVEVK